MTRLIQYISKKNLENLFKKIKKSMKKEGVLVISYTKSGGIFNQDYSIKTYSYSVSEIIKSLKRNNLEINILRRGSKKTEYVPYKESAEIYEIIAKNK